MDTRSIRTPSTKVLAEEERLASLEERYRHELMDDEERCELRERIYGSPDGLCERCLRGLCEWARSEYLDVAWKDAHEIYADAGRRYTEPMQTREEMLSMSREEENRILEAAYLT